MNDPILEFKKAAKAVAAASKAVNAAVKAQGRSQADPLEVHASSLEAARELARVGEIENLAAALVREFTVRADRSRGAADRRKALVAGKAAAGLEEAGITVTGNLPRLRAGVFTLEFDFEKKAGCVVWFGPRKHRMFTCPLEPTEIVEKVKRAYEHLFGADWDEGAFLADLDSAYRVTTTRLGLEPGDSAPITSIMAEVAFQRQGPGFMADPRRDLYVPYTRVDFAVDLSRLRNRRLADREMRLEVATMAQTRGLEGHLWVPRGDSMDGVNYSGVRFVPVPTRED
ncbi:MAG: hypothetical protein GXP54_08230 [Deltaproteobacteria bacterium]|nr:hypothetical protein [Deltaproteobacteria bacterium]